MNQPEGQRVQLSIRSEAVKPSQDGQLPRIGNEVVSVPVLSLRAGDSPRLNGEDKAHIAQLADTETPLPPILVDRRTMRVIDGMHRLMAASLRGKDMIDVIFFDGTEADVFLRAVQENVAHGLPLSQADRRAAAERIIASHPHMSDRAIGQASGLAARAVASIRKRSSEHLPQSNARVGRDGRVRPLDSGDARRRAAELLTQQPEASLREVARAAGISPATVLDVRKRLARGDSPVPERPAARKRRSGSVAARNESAAGGVTVGHVGDGGEVSPVPQLMSVDAAAVRPAVPLQRLRAVLDDSRGVVEKLMRDPSLRNNEQGKVVLRMLHSNAAGSENLASVVTAVPSHCVTTVVLLARQYAQMWQELAQELDRRARIVDVNI